MDFDLTPQQKDFQEFVRNFAEKEVKPIAAEIDEQERFPRETVTKMARENLMGIPYPQAVRGAGRDTLSYILAIEEISRVCGATGDILSTHTSLASHPIYQFGSNNQKKKYLFGLNEGRFLGAFCLTEPEAGTDSSAQKTTAVLHEDAYILNGSKMFITNGGEADVCIVFAMTNPSLGQKASARSSLKKIIQALSLQRSNVKWVFAAASPPCSNSKTVTSPEKICSAKKAKVFRSP